MDDERRMILQMVSDGKITPEEAERLLQAVDESERPPARPATDPTPDIGESVDRAIRESIKGFDQVMRGVEHGLGARLKEMELDLRTSEKLRRAADRASEQVARAQERAQRMQERAAEAMERAAERAVERAAEQAEHGGRESSFTFTKLGISIDKESVTQRGSLVMPAQDGDKVFIDNRVGDITIEFVDADTVQVDATKVVWGEDLSDAQERAARTKLIMVRRGAGIHIETERPVINGFGVMVLKDTHVDLTVRLPHGTMLAVANKVGNLDVIGGARISKWDLKTKVGDIKMTIGEGSLRYDLATKVGTAEVELGQHRKSGRRFEGSIGDGSGTIVAEVKTGDIWLRH